MLPVPFFSVFLTGFAASTGQVLILRELLVLFYGNELSTGLIFASWLLWTALGTSVAKHISREAYPGGMILPYCLPALALLLPSTMLLIRASRSIWSIPLGEILQPGTMFAIALSVTSLFCLVSGIVFSLAWAQAASADPGRRIQPIGIYLGEAAGAAAGGIFYYFVLLPHIPAFAASLVTCAFVSLFAGFVFLPRLVPGGIRTIFASAVLGLFILICTGFALSNRLDAFTRRLEWGPSFLAARDTPFHNLALLEKADQLSLFANGLWLFSVPDPQTAEYAVHLALLQHPHPESVLLIGGSAGGLASEVLKYESVRKIDCIEPDPEITNLVRTFFPVSVTGAFSDPRIRLFHEDAASFIRNTPDRFDAILMNLGDPLNAEMNRFYTVEFMSRISRLLNRGGIFSFAVSSAPDVIGPAQARFLRSLDATVRAVFPTVLVIPGENARFLATTPGGSLISSPRELIARIAERHLDLRFVRDYYLLDYLNPMRLEYMETMLREGPAVKVNRDFNPTCYFSNLMVWSAQQHPLVESTLLRLSAVDRTTLWGTTAGILILVLLLHKAGWLRRRSAVAMNVMIVGGVQMTLEMILLVGFQILVGFVYTQLALIVAFFMAGMALGSAAAVRGAHRMKNSLRGLILVQFLVSLLPIAILAILLGLQHRLETAPQTLPPMPLLFASLAAGAGFLGGIHFSLAVAAASELQPSSTGNGPMLYAADLMGAAGGVVVSSLFLVPVFGLSTTLFTLAFVTLGGSFTLIGKRV